MLDLFRRSKEQIAFNDYVSVQFKIQIYRAELSLVS